MKEPFLETLYYTCLFYLRYKKLDPSRRCDYQFENVQLHLMKVFESAIRTYDRHGALLCKVCPEISILLPEKELTSIIIYTINSLSNQTLPLLGIWKLLFHNQQTEDLQNILLIAELCLYAPFSNAAIECFFSQMRIVKTDWKNELNEKNLSSLLYIKTQGPIITEFRNHYCSPTVNLWLKDKDKWLNQRKPKKYKKKRC